MNQYLAQDEIVELTRDLIRVPSVNPPADTRRCAEIILNKFKKDHIDAEIVEGRKGACNVVEKVSRQRERELSFYSMGTWTSSRRVRTGPWIPLEQKSKITRSMAADLQI